MYTLKLDDFSKICVFLSQWDIIGELMVNAFYQVLNIF